MRPHQPPMVGRDAELAALANHLERASDGRGGAVVVSGEAGLGKTTLVEAFKEKAIASKAIVLSGGASADRLDPFHAVSKALAGALSAPLFETLEQKAFSSVLAFDAAGSLLAKSSTVEKGNRGPEAFAAMLAAVQGFVRDSFGADQRGGPKGLGRLECGDSKILVEGSENLSLAAVFAGGEHPDMRARLGEAAKRLGGPFGTMLASGAKEAGALAPLQKELDALSKASFTVRKDLSSVRLEGERVRIADRVLNELAAISSERTVAVVLEDMHWADESSLFVFGYLARNMPGRRILVLATARPGEGAAFEKALGRLREEKAVSEIRLGRVTGQDIRDIVDAQLRGNDFPQGFVEGLAAKCEGNPFFVTELLRQMVASGKVVADGPGFRLAGEGYDIPDSLEAVVQGRLESLTHGAMALAEYASCIGREFGAAVALSGQAMADAGNALAELQSRGIVVAGEATMAFSHALFQEIVYKGLAPRWRSAHHRSIGEYYERAHQGRLSDVAYELARHFSETGENEKAYAYCRSAGEKAAASYAAEQAIFFNSRALARLPLAKAEGPDRTMAEIDILDKLGEAYTLVGEYGKGLDSYSKALALVTGARERADLHRKIANVYERQSEYDRSRAECDAGLELLGETDCSERARLLLARGWTWLRTGEYGKAGEDFAAGLGVSLSVGDEREVSYAHHSIGTVALYLEKYPEAVEHLGAALEMRERLGDENGASKTLNNLGMVYSELGDFDKALGAYERSLALMKKIGDKNNLGSLAINMGMTLSDLGEVERALSYTLEGCEAAKRVGDKYGMGTALNNIGNFYFDLGVPNKALEYYRQALALRTEVGDQYGQAMTLLNIGDECLDTGDSEKALEHYERSIGIFSEIGEKRGLAHVYTSLVELYLKLGKAGTAEEYGRKALAICLEIGARFEEAMSRHMLALVLGGRKDYGAAEEEFGESVAIYEEVKGNKDLAKVYYDYGRMLAAKGDNAGARDLLERARPMFERMGMKAWVAKCDSVSGDGSTNRGGFDGS